MSSKIQIPVFIETNMGTRIAIPISPDINTRNFKGELERAHVDCFPELGFLSINAVMVKMNSYLYHLPDSLPLKHVFKGSQNSWFLYVNASVSKTRKEKKRKRRSRAKVLHECRRKKLEGELTKPKGSSFGLTERNGQQDVLHLSEVSDFNVPTESSCESLSGVVSVSGIINRYFKNSFDIDDFENTANSEVTPKNGKCDVERNYVSKRSSKKRRERLLPSLLQDGSNSVSLMNRYERSEVGKRLVVASKNLESSQRSAVSKCKKLWDLDARSVVRNLVFEINDND